MKNIILKFPILIHVDNIKSNNEYTSDNIKSKNSIILTNLINHLKLNKISLNYIIQNLSYGNKIKNIEILPDINFDDALNSYIGFLDIKLNENLNENEIDDIKGYLEWEFSDGFGEGFEQEPFYIETINCNNVLKKEYYAHFWNTENWFIKEV